MARRLIEDWLPVAALSEESMRERRSMTSLPPIYYLHVWWARRPLVASRAAVLASLLPADADHDKFLHMLGIHGDPVETRKKLEEAKKTGENLGLNPYGYGRSFTYSPDRKDLEWFKSEMLKEGIESGTVLDPTAGGGSIPFEAVRLGLNIYANDLNPVAALVEKATIEWPLLGEDVLKEYQRLSEEFIKRAEPRYEGIYPKEAPNTQVLGYLFARTIRCPHCNGLIPLSPNWRLAPDGTGVRLVPDLSHGDRVMRFEIVNQASEQSRGTVAGGDAICPYPDCGRTVAGAEIKKIAQAAEMGEQLYAIVYKKRQDTVLKSGKKGRPKWIRGYRAPEPADDVFAAIAAKLAEKMPEWEAQDLVPNENIPEGMKTREPHNYGVNFWRDMFSPRQLYCHVTSVEVFTELLNEARQKPDFGEAQKAAFGYLALALDKDLNFNVRSTRWSDGRGTIVGSFDRHDFSFKWSFGEMAQLVIGSGYEWAFGQIGKALKELISLLRLECDDKPLLDAATGAKPQIVLSCGPGAELRHIPDHSIDAVVMDPPYYDNVMYAELSDFFYVWLKRTAGQIWPELFKSQLTDKLNEAVANPALFDGKKKPAQAAYRDAMAAIFAETRRCLKPDGILTVMFSHKATGAWDALAKGLMEAGFAISASWPVSSEAEGSLHIREKAAAKSNIFLVCRPRQKPERELYWEEIEAEVKRASGATAEKFFSQGISGIDLYLASYGPALSLFSQHWPVRRENGEAVAPEEALKAAGAAVREWRLGKLLETATSGFDPLLEWYLLAWDAFGAPVFPYDEALNLARVAGLELERDIIGTLGQKKGQDFQLWDGATRQAHGLPGAGKSQQLDAIQNLAAIAATNGLSAANGHLVAEKLAASPEFRQALAAACAVLPKGSPDGQNLAALLHLISDSPKSVQPSLLDGQTR
ncbi:MAG: DUF1156 domain-containing protein [Desulfovibrio sp.]|nr:DUF1156 domain-containing protein [Desulfovibrio sp.]